jgi:hypothetical protein
VPERHEVAERREAAEGHVTSKVIKMSNYREVRAAAGFKGRWPRGVYALSCARGDAYEKHLAFLALLASLQDFSGNSSVFKDAQGCQVALLQMARKRRGELLVIVLVRLRIGTAANHYVAAEQ